MMMILFSFLFLIPLSFFGIWWSVMGFMFILFFVCLINLEFSDYFILMSYSFGGDLLSISLVMLTIWIIVLMILASYSVECHNNHKNEFMIVCLMLLLFLMLTFLTSNLFLFYLFFEASLIPTLLLIFGWGYQPERLMAGYYLLFYTLFASLPMLVGIFYIYSVSCTLNYFLVSIDSGIYLYFSMVIAFLVKMPLVFLHFWLPSAHVEAPISGSMILAGILLKLGGYGLMRVLGFMGDLVYFYSYIWICLSLFGMFLVGLICLSQTDIKSLIAYSSVAHMALVVCGIFTLNVWGLYGSLVLMIAHGLCSSALFCLANVSYERVMSRSFYINSGLITFMPTLSLFWFLMSANNMACPPSLNLMGEIMLINSIMGWSTLSMLFLGASAFLSCCYSMYLYSCSQHGSLFNSIKSVSSGSIREFLLILFHWIPLNFIVLSVDIFTLWI